MQVRILFCLLTAQLIAGIAAQEDCPGGWLDFGTFGCYKFLTDASGLSWFEASAECEMVGGYLAEPKTKAISDILQKQGAVYQAIAGVDHWYIGLTDFANEGTWTWYHSGEPLTENSWGPGRPRPDQSLEHDCAALVLQEDDSYFWDDINCFPEPESLGAPICQTGSTGSPSTATPPTGGTTTTSGGGGGSTPSGNCPTGWLDYGGNAYCVVTESAAWDSAEAGCAGLGGHLASILSAAENSYLGSVTNSKSFWIGASDAAAEGTWTWNDGSSWGFTAWDDGQPNGGTGENCAYVSSGVVNWQDYNCATSLISVCKVIGGGSPTSEQPSTTYRPTTTSTTTTTTTTPATGPCNSGWQQNGGHQYCAHSETATWEDAEAACVNQGGHLASILSDSENSFVGGLMSGSGFFIGGSDAASEGSWTWSDGESFSFTKWGSNKPGNSKYDNCIWVYPDSFTWADYNCKGVQPFVCKA